MRPAILGLAFMAIGGVIEVILHLTAIQFFLALRTAVSSSTEAVNAVNSGISALDMFGIVPAGFGIILIIYDIWKEYEGSGGSV